MGRVGHQSHRHHVRPAAEQGDPGGPNGEYADLDLTSKREKTGGPPFASITARSYHPGGVNALLGNGSVHFVKSNIDGRTWWSLGTVSGAEVSSADSY